MTHRSPRFKNWREIDAGTYGQLGSIRWSISWEKARPIKSKIKSLILKFWNFTIRIYVVKQMAISQETNFSITTQIKQNTL